MTVFIPNGESQGRTATWLLATADENDIDRRSIKTTRGGFNVPDELAAALGLVAPVPEPPIEPFVSTSFLEMPEVGSQFVPELPVVDVQLAADGRVVLTAEAAEREIAAGTVVLSSEEHPRKVIQDLDSPFVGLVNENEPVVDREVVRAWAKDQGLNPAEKGALKKAVLDAYAAAHQI